MPAYRKTILRAMARYGMYVTDTGGSWAVIQESGLVTMSFGLGDRWADLARSVGAPYWPPDHRYAIDIRDGVDWAPLPARDRSVRRAADMLRLERSSRCTS